MTTEQDALEPCVCGVRCFVTSTSFRQVSDGTIWPEKASLDCFGRSRSAAGVTMREANTMWNAAMRALKEKP